MDIDFCDGESLVEHRVPLHWQYLLDSFIRREGNEGKRTRLSGLRIDGTANLHEVNPHKTSRIAVLEHLRGHHAVYVGAYMVLPTTIYGKGRQVLSQLPTAAGYMPL